MTDYVVGVTMGHPSGIGPEVIVRSICAAPVRGARKVVIFGDRGVLERAARLAGLQAKLKAAIRSGAAGVVEVSALHEREASPGLPSEAGSLAQVDYIREAVAWTQDGRVAAIATGPISKAGMQSGGYNFPGHTELFAKLAGVEDVAMMFSGPRLKVALATIHVPLAEVPGLLKADLILKRLRLAVRAMRVFYGVQNPRVGVSALNPHGGEEGRMGREEIRVIAPAVELARGEGIKAFGPLPADTLFHQALHGEYDLVMAMYHDQAMIPIKTLGFGRSVNITLGLPFVRTSPDHGTAFDLAPRSMADPAGMSHAIATAARLAPKLLGKDPWTV